MDFRSRSREPKAQSKPRHRPVREPFFLSGSGYAEGTLSLGQ